MLNGKSIISFDPGRVTGVARGYFGDETPLVVVSVSEITYPQFLNDQYLGGEWYRNDIVISELFTPRSNNFVADVTGVRVEGIIEYLEPRVIWRPASKKAQVPDQILKDHGLWRTGKNVDWEDGRDVNDAIIHMLGYVAFDLRHGPTLRKYFR